MAIVAVDNGHGLNTPGKRTPKMPDGTVIHEWQFNHPTAKKLEAELKRCGFDVVMVSDTKSDTLLSTRVSRANKAKADVFVSIHYNAYQGKWGDHGGVDTFHYPGSIKGKKLAESVQPELVKASGLRDRGVKSKNFYVLRKTTMPAILCECGFMDNLEEAKLMLDENYQQKVAEAICKGICKYLGVSYVPQATPAPEKLYRVQTGAFEQKKNAGSLMTKVQKAGFDTYMVYHNGLYKVQVGAYAIRENAENMAKKLKAKGFDVYITIEAGQPVSSSKTSTSTKTIKVGSKVKVRKGARSYEGKKVADFVYNRVYTVDQLKGDRAVLDLKGICTAFKVSDLILQ